jgi:hypothetical protein
MKILAIFSSTFLVWAAYDSNLFRRRGERYASSHISYVAGPESQVQHKVKKHYQREVIPPWYKRPPPKLKMKVNHFNVKTKDPRYSDQRKIRRRINNL